MRKVFAIGMMIALGILLYVYIGNISEKDQIEENLKDNILTEEDLLLNIESNYEGILEQMRLLQRSPEQITKFHCMLTKLIYSGELTDDQLEAMVKLQRETYADKLLENNPVDMQLFLLTRELKEYKTYGSEGLKVIAYKTNGSEYYNDVIEYGGQDIAIVRVVYYFNLTNFILSEDASDGLDDNGYIGYVLTQNEDKLWEVAGFAGVDAFTTVEDN